MNIHPKTVGLSCHGCCLFNGEIMMADSGCLLQVDDEMTVWIWAVISFSWKFYKCNMALQVFYGNGKEKRKRGGNSNGMALKNYCHKHYFPYIFSRHLGKGFGYVRVCVNEYLCVSSILEHYNRPSRSQVHGLSLLFRELVVQVGNNTLFLHYSFSSPPQPSHSWWWWWWSVLPPCGIMDDWFFCRVHVTYKIIIFWFISKSFKLLKRKWIFCVGANIFAA